MSVRAVAFSAVLTDWGRPLQGSRMRSLGLDLLAITAGDTAMRLATTRTPATSPPMRRIGTADTGTAPRLSVNASHITRPNTTPSGTPMTIPTRATVVACQATADV